MKEIKTQKTILNETIIYTYNPRYNKKYTYKDIATAPTLERAYRQPSAEKHYIYNQLVKQASHNNYDTYGIISYNCNYFTFAYVKDNILYIDTYANRYWCYLAD